MTDLPIGPELRREDIFVESFLADYNHGISFIYFYLQKLHTNIYLVEKILKFPRVFLLEPDGLQTDFFFRCFIENAIEASILIITRFVQNTRGNVFRITDFQNKLLQAIRPEYKSAYIERLKNNKFDQNIREIIRRLETLRDRRIAHLTQEYLQGILDGSINPTDDLISLLPEIKAVSEKLADCLHNVNFIGGKFILQIYDLYPVFVPSRPDIEIILDSIAKNSPILHLPENDPSLWYKIMDPRREQITQFNYYRKKFGMPAVSL